ncbi:MAG TPA: hypothetical protein VGS57_16035 [Thermoanaerobaculia bacterium]|jgi:hypothetical protein|nr:hypothetical protein [Thermoanaerobaculia bacterium]
MPKSRAVRLLVLIVFACCAAAPVFAAPKKPAATAPAQPSVAANEAELQTFDDDADLPAFMRGKIDKVEYMKLRADAIAQKLGFPYGTTAYNPRAKAIRETEAAEASPAHQSSPDISETSWTELGPNPIPNGQTTTTSFAVSGRTVAIAVHPTDPNKVYVGTAQGGLYRSLDGGATWTALTDGILTLAIGAVAIDPSDTTRVWIGTGESGFSADSWVGVGLYRISNAESVSPTIDGPFNINTGSSDVMTFRSISRIMIHPTLPNTVFVGTASGVGGLFGVNGSPLPGRGVFRSQDALSATPHFDRLDVPTGSTNVAATDIALEPGNPDHLVVVSTIGCVAATCGIWRSTNANAVAPTFTRTFAMTTTPVRGELAVNPAAPLNMLAAIDGATGGAGCAATAGRLIRSTDGGATWGAPIAGANGFCGGQCFYDIFVAMDPTDATGNKIFLGGAANGTCTRVYTQSTDGTTFSGAGVRDVGLHADSHAIAVAPSNPLIVYESSDGGIFKSIDGGLTWASLNNTTFRATQFQSVAYHPTDPNFSIGGTQDNGTEFMNSAGVWTRADFGDGGQSAIDQSSVGVVNVTSYHTYFNQTNNLIGYARNNVVACYNDGGGLGNWTFHGIYGGAVDPTVYCDGTSDTFNGIAITDSTEFYAPLTLGPGTPNTVYFGTNKLYRSANKGDTAATVSQVMASTITAIAIAPSNDSVRIVGLRNGGIFKTTTAGNPLDDADAGNTVPNQIVNRIAIDPSNPDVAYVGLNSYGLLAAGQHIWKTSNLSAVSPTWTASGTGIPDVPVNAIVINPGNTMHLYAGTDIGVYNSTDGGATWAPYNTGLPRVAVFDMALQNVAGNRRLRIATHGRGLWERVPVSVPVELLDATVEPSP